MDKMIGFLSNTLTTTLYNNNSIIDYNHHIPLFLTFMFFFFSVFVKTEYFSSFLASPIP